MVENVKTRLILAFIFEAKESQGRGAQWSLQRVRDNTGWEMQIIHQSAHALGSLQSCFSIKDMFHKQRMKKKIIKGIPWREHPQTVIPLVEKLYWGPSFLTSQALKSLSNGWQRCDLLDGKDPGTYLFMPASSILYLEAPESIVQILKPHQQPNHGRKLHWDPWKMPPQVW